MHTAPPAQSVAASCPHPVEDDGARSAPPVAVNASPDEKESWLKKKKAAEKKKKALINRLQSEAAPDLWERLARCGEEYPLICTCCGDRLITETHCMARYCPVCQPRVTAQRFERWRSSLEKIRWPLFVTLTIPNSLDVESLQTLKKSWQKFRRRKIIASKVEGGLATYEVTNKGKGWHPHLHAIMDCRWLALETPEPAPTDSAAVKKEKCAMARRELTAAWSDLLGVSYASCHAKRAAGLSAVHEIVKYAVKSSDLIESPDPIAPMLRMLRKTRTLAGWGSLYPLPSPDDDDGPQSVCRECGNESPWMPEEIVRTYFSQLVPVPSIPYKNRT